MGNKRALAAAPEETTAEAFSSQAGECEIAAQRCSLPGLRVISGRSNCPRRQQHIQPSQRLGLIFRRRSAEGTRQNLSPSYWVTLHSTSTNNSGEPSN